MRTFLITISLLITTTTLNAEGIDLKCDQLAKKIVDGLISEGIINNESSSRERTYLIAQQQCGSVEIQAQQQHETGIKEALADWFTRGEPETAGHKRLKKK